MNPSSLPRRLDEVAGLRAARWIRESSTKQGDRYGPGAQRQMQDTSIERYGLVDTGLSWMVLKSGWSGADSMYDPPATRTADFQEMLRAAEAGLFDVLLVGYTSRFLRDVQMTLHYRRFFHRNGVVILISDDRILTSDPNDWERLVDKVKADEVYSRNLGRNIRTGLAEKRRSMGDPGGQPPLGYRREAKLLVVDPSTMPTVERAYALSASGQPDTAVADAIGVTLDTVRHVLTNPVYIGRLTDGQPFRLGAAVGMDTWNLVQARREKRRTRVPGVSKRQCFALKLVCGSCKLALHGHTDRYRHARPVCAAFAAAQPATTAVRGRHATSAGNLYPTQWYEAVIELLLDRIAITDERVIQSVIAGLSEGREQTLDQVSLARIARARSEALRRLEDTRDVETWKVTVASPTPRRQPLGRLRRRCG